MVLLTPIPIANVAIALSVKSGCRIKVLMACRISLFVVRCSLFVVRCSLFGKANCLPVAMGTGKSQFASNPDWRSGDALGRLCEFDHFRPTSEPTHLRSSGYGGQAEPRA